MADRGATIGTTVERIGAVTPRSVGTEATASASVSASPSASVPASPSASVLASPSASASPSVVSQLGAIDLATFTELPGPYRAAVVFAVVLAIGTVLVARYDARVDRAVDQTADWSPLAVLYGLFAFVLVSVIALYVITQVARLNVVGAPLLAITAVGAGSVTILATFGYVVLGTWLTEIEGARRPWPGAVVGAVLGAVPWLVLPTMPALAVCALVAAVGLGSPTRNWVHASHAVDTDRTA